MRLLVSVLMSAICAGTCFGGEIAVRLKAIQVTNGTGNELTDTYRWDENGQRFVLYANGVLESNNGKKLSLRVSKDHHVYNLWAGSAGDELFLSYIDYSGGYGIDRICAVRMNTHKLSWCRRTQTQVVEEFRTIQHSVSGAKTQKE